LGIPVLVWGSPNQNGDPQTEMGMRITRIPKPIRGSPNRNGDQDIPIPKWGSPNQYRDCSVTNPYQYGVHSDLGTDRTYPQIGTALKMGTPYWYGDPHIGMGRDINIPNRGVPIPIWGSFQFGDQHLYQFLHKLRRMLVQNSSISLSLNLRFSEY
jgi:hypothetical protein